MSDIDKIVKGLCREFRHGYISCDQEVKAQVEALIQKQVQEAYDRGYADKARKADEDLVNKEQLYDTREKLYISQLKQENEEIRQAIKTLMSYGVDDD